MRASIPLGARRPVASPAVLRALELGYALVGIIYYNGGIIAALRSARGDGARQAGEAEIFSTLTQAFLLLVLIPVAIGRRKELAALARQLWPVLLITGLTLLSTAWSEDPAVSARRAISYATCVLFGITLFQRYGLRRTIVLVGNVAVGLGALSILVFFAVPSIGHESAQGYEGAMRGVFAQKNPMAECMLLGLTCWGYRIVDEDRLRPSSLAAILLLVSCILLGKSASSLGVALVLMVVAAYMYLCGNTPMRAALLFVCGWAVVTVVLLAVLAPELLTAASGRDASLTGRVPLWSAVLGAIGKKPWLGYGYAGFWVEDSIRVQYLWQWIQWRAPDAHNGYLDILLSLGLVGFACYVLLWGRLVRLLAIALRAGDLPVAKWVLLFAIAVLLMDVDEGPLPMPNEFTMMISGALVTLSAFAASYRPPRRHPPPLFARAQANLG